MGRAIPFFYADLIARMVPGAVALALVQLANLQLPTAWTPPSFGGADPVLLPIIYGGMAYVVGTLLEVTLSAPLEFIYHRAFTCAASTHAWSDAVTLTKSTDWRSRFRRFLRTLFCLKIATQASHLSRASFGHLIVAVTDREQQAVPHLIRFHSEAKMCAGILTLVLVTAVFVGPADWYGILAVSVAVLAYTTFQRLLSRARFVIRTIDRLAEPNGADGATRLRKEICEFGARVNEKKCSAF
jgi:hypothetical protein